MRLRLLCLGLCAAVMLISAPLARANDDAVHFFSDIRVPAGTTAHDAVCFFCSVHADGEVNGDIVVFFGNVHIGSAAHHDVVSFFSGVDAEDDATIGHDLVNFFGSVHLGHNVSVGEDMVTMFGVVHAPDSVTVHGNSVTFPFWVFGGPMLLVCLLIYGMVREVRARRYRAYMAAHYPFPPRV
jgi:hypothetical protein